MEGSQDSGLSQVMLEVGMLSVETDTAKSEARLTDHGQKAKGFTFKMAEG